MLLLFPYGQSKVDIVFVQIMSILSGADVYVCVCTCVWMCIYGMKDTFISVYLFCVWCFLLASFSLSHHFITELSMMIFSSLQRMECLDLSFKIISIFCYFVLPIYFTLVIKAQVQGILVLTFERCFCILSRPFVHMFTGFW